MRKEGGREKGRVEELKKYTYTHIYIYMLCYIIFLYHQKIARELESEDFLYHYIIILYIYIIHYV